jgi:hypothetical protein
VTEPVPLELKLVKRGFSWERVRKADTFIGSCGAPPPPPPPHPAVIRAKKHKRISAVIVCHGYILKGCFTFSSFFSRTSPWPRSGMTDADGEVGTGVDGRTRTGTAHDATGISDGGPDRYRRDPLEHGSIEANEMTGGQDGGIVAVGADQADSHHVSIMQIRESWWSDYRIAREVAVELV